MAPEVRCYGATLGFDRLFSCGDLKKTHDVQFYFCLKVTRLVEVNATIGAIGILADVRYGTLCFIQRSAEVRT
jgi:hypothetical protein